MKTNPILKTTLAPLLFGVSSLISCLSVTTGSRVRAEDVRDGSTTIEETPITADDREHWSLKPIVRPALPIPANAEPARNAIDYFVLHRLEKDELSLSSPAPPRQILRRMMFDLHGLPPSVADLQCIPDKSTSDWVSAVADRLLGSPRYGERWAQFWLDLARYAETDGFEHDKVRQDAWRYRDWVVNALNVDMPYDQFLRHQLAADQLQSTSQIQPPDMVATMFCLAGPDMPDINEQDLRRHDKLNEITSTVGAVILGMQFQCAQCHDHKYDPISQADFYRLRAIFEDAVPVMKRDKHVLTLAQSDTPPPRLYHRGDIGNAGPVVSPGVPRLAVLNRDSHLCETERPRLEFCDWLFTEENPLTARVIANRVWQHHFGKSLTGNPSDFGVIAAEPSHPELLDWLAAELMENDWSIKHLQRLILNSATYRQAGIEDNPNYAVAQERDPRNDYFSHFPLRRLEGEVIRDALLATSGSLNRQMGGASVFPPLPPELSSTLLKNQWNPSPQPSEHHRRSIYIFARRNLRYPIFDACDRPDAGASCATRDESTTAIQSLMMLNSRLTLQCAEDLVELVVAAEPSHAQAASQMFARVLGRPPNDGEQTLIRKQLTGVTDHNIVRENLITLAVALYNTNEFMYID